MKGARQEDGKVTSPMFPRLHVNDADKGGPRAPPRNKMALYEQLSVPSQRFKRAADPAFPVSLRNSAASVPSASSCQGFGHETSLQSSHLTEKGCLSSDVKSSNPPKQELARRSAKHVGCESVNAPAHLRSNSHNLPSSKNSKRKECEDDDFTVPTLFLSDKDHHASEAPSVQAEITERSASSNHNSIIGLPESHNHPQGHSASTDFKSRKHERNEQDQAPKECASPKIRKQNSTAVGSGEKYSNMLNLYRESYHQEAMVMSDNQRILCNGDRKLRESSSCNGTWSTTGCSAETEVAENRDVSVVKNGSVSKTPNTNNPHNRNKARAEDYIESEENKSESLDDSDTEKNEDLSDTSMVDSDTGFDISPDDVAGVIGPKHFWKARRAIVNQQRAFSVQVFELHRLIKVQKLIAGSPDLLLEENPNLHRSSEVQIKINSSEQNLKSQLQIAKQKEDSHKTNVSVHSSGNTPRAIPLSSEEDSFNRSHVNKVPTSEPCPGNPNPVPMSTENRSNSCCSHPQGNQWLVPVLSPTEGLVYKPYMGPHPQHADFMTPVFRGCSPMAVPPLLGNFMNTAYGFLAQHQLQNFGIIPGNHAVVPHHFSALCGLPVVNSATPGSTFEKSKLSTGVQFNAHIKQQSCNSFDTTNPSSEVISGPAHKIQASSHSEFHGSSASSPIDKLLPFGSMSPVIDGCGQPVRNRCKDHKTQAIKVVPHNAISATESAARIFRCIQEERLQCG